MRTRRQFNVTQIQSLISHSSDHADGVQRIASDVEKVVRQANRLAGGRTDYGGHRFQQRPFVVFQLILVPYGRRDLL